MRKASFRWTWKWRWIRFPNPKNWGLTSCLKRRIVKSISTGWIKLALQATWSGSKWNTCWWNGSWQNHIEYCYHCLSRWRNDRGAEDQLKVFPHSYCSKGNFEKMEEGAFHLVSWLLSFHVLRGSRWEIGNEKYWFERALVRCHIDNFWSCYERKVLFVETEIRLFNTWWGSQN